jgi:hypothetical protein
MVVVVGGRQRPRVVAKTGEMGGGGGGAGMVVVVVPRATTVGELIF